MIITKNYEGAWILSDIVDGYWVDRCYYFYTKREAIALFKKYIKELKQG